MCVCRPLNAISNNRGASLNECALCYIGVLSLNALSIFNDAPSSVSHQTQNRVERANKARQRAQQTRRKLYMRAGMLTILIRTWNS